MKKLSSRDKTVTLAFPLEVYNILSRASNDNGTTPATLVKYILHQSELLSPYFADAKIIYQFGRYSVTDENSISDYKMVESLHDSVNITKVNNNTVHESLTTAINEQETSSTIVGKIRNTESSPTVLPSSDFDDLIESGANPFDWSDVDDNGYKKFLVYCELTGDNLEFMLQKIEDKSTGRIQSITYKGLIVRRMPDGDSKAFGIVRDMKKIGDVESKLIEYYKNRAIDC